MTLPLPYPLIVVTDATLFALSDGTLKARSEIPYGMFRGALYGAATVALDALVGKTAACAFLAYQGFDLAITLHCYLRPNNKMIEGAEAKLTFLYPA